MGESNTNREWVKSKSAPAQMQQMQVAVRPCVFPKMRRYHSAEARRERAELLGAQPRYSTQGGQYVRLLYVLWRSLEGLERVVFGLVGVVHLGRRPSQRLAEPHLGGCGVTHVCV